MRIFLTGFMGSGKSTLGRELASRLGWPFFDLDDILEHRAGCSIRDYIGKHGEEEFRRLEASTLREYPFPANSVIATGGGTPCFYGNMQFLREQGKVVYLEVEAEELHRRLESDKDKRPLLKTVTGKQGLLERIREMLGKREPFYREAHVIWAKTVVLSPEVINRLVER